MLPSSPIGRLLGHLPPRLAHLVRYSSVSVIATAVGLSTLAVLIDIGHWPPAWANIVATALGTIPSFELNRRWVWGRNERRSLLGEIVPFAGLCLVELVASTAAVHAMAAWTAHAGWSQGVRTLADLAANVATYGALWVVQYVMLDRVLFARRPPPPERDFQPPSRSNSSPVQEASAGWQR
jgi:putative flippase GtrA